MTVPQATKQISPNPGQYAVTSPTVKKDQEADVERKLKLYGAIQAFREGSFPSNEQIDKVLLYAENASPVDPKNLSPDGRNLINDIRDIIETVRLIILTKNDDELMQNFLYHTRTVDKPSSVNGSDIPVSKDDLKGDAAQASTHLRTLLTLVLTNSEMRKVISDLGLVGRDLFASAASRTAAKARPDEDQLNQIDQEAPADQWEGAGGKKHGHNETPQLEVNVGGHKITHDPKAPIQEGVVHTDPNGNQTNAGEAANKARDTKEQASQQSGGVKSQMQDAKQKAKGTAAQKAEEGKQAYNEGGVEGVKDHGQRMRNDAGDAADNDTAASAKGKFAAFKDKITPGDNSRGKVDESKEKLQNFFDEEFPQERRDQLIYRLKKVVVECQKHNDYDEAISFFLDKAETYKGHTKNVSKTGVQSSGSIVSDPGFQQAYEEMKTLLERFADGKSMDKIIDAVNNLYTDAQNDDALREWFSKLDTYIRKCLLEPGYILDDDSNTEGRALRESGRTFFDHKYKAHKDAFFDEVGNFFSAMGQDPVNARFGEDIKRLTKDLLFDENGTLTFKPELWNDIRTEILPTLINQVGYVPIPRIEYTDKQIDLVIENLVLQGSNLFPNVVELEANNFFKFSPYKSIPDKGHHKFRLHFSQIQADMRDVGFYFKKKTGFPRLADRGLADVLLSGNGLSVDVTLESAGKRKDHAFLVKGVDATVDAIKFNIRDSKHDTIYKIVAPLAQGLIKKTIGLAIEQAIRTGLEYVDEQLVEVRDRMDEAKDSDSMSRTDALKQMFQRKKEKGEVRKDQAKQKTEERGSQFAVVTSRDDSVIPNSNPPHSVGEKLFEKEHMAKAGKTWHSPAFDIVGPTAVTGPGATGNAGSNANRGTNTSGAAPGTTGAGTTGTRGTTTSGAAPGTTASPKAAYTNSAPSSNADAARHAEAASQHATAAAQHASAAEKRL